MQFSPTQESIPYDINFVFQEFCKFLNFPNNGQADNSNFLQPNSQQFLPLPPNITQQTSINQPFQMPQNCANTTQHTNNTHMPQFLAYANNAPNSIDPKRMSYISQAIEKRKVFFNGKQGSDPHRFLVYLNECITSMGITQAEVYNCLPVVLHGEALDWFRINKTKLPNFEAFSKALVSNFSVKNYQNKLIYEALARQQGKNEPITTFITNIRLIFNQMEPQLPESRQIDIACNNLNPNYIQQIRRSHIKSFEDLIDEGKDVENNLDKIKNYKGPPNPSTALLKSAAWPKKSSERANITKKAPEKDELAATKSDKGTANNNTRKPKKESSSDKHTATNTKTTECDITDMPNAGECYKCRQQGHLFKDCPNESKLKFYCYRCGKGKVTVVKCPNCKDRKGKNE